MEIAPEHKILHSLAKTDRVDALMLARFGALLEPIVQAAPTACQIQLCELVAAHRALVKDRTATLNRLQMLSIQILKRHAQHRLRQIAAQIISIERELENLISTDPVLVRRHQDELCVILGDGRDQAAR